MNDILPELNNRDYILSLADDYDIHFCQKDEISDLVRFIDQYWRKNHIFVLSRELLDWQHYSVKNERYNFVIARHKATGEIHSILGFVPTSQFDENIEKSEIWPCIWKSREDIHRKGLGVSLYYYLKTQLDIETISVLGISEVALSIYKHWGFITGKIGQFYFPNMKHPEILSSHRQMNSCGGHERGWSLRRMTLSEFESLDETSVLFKRVNIYKSKKFYINRFFKHPIYRYLVFGICYNESVTAVVIARECSNGQSSCLRIVDYLGELQCLRFVSIELQKLMINYNYEYIDFIVAGVDVGVLESIGFVDRRSDPDTVIPNYFEPFLKENVDLDFAYKTINPDYSFSMFKADADQDRPNTLPHG